MGQAGATSLPFENHSFDVVLMNSVLYYVEDRQKAIDEAHRVLRPGGRLGITTHLDWEKHLFVSVMNELVEDAVLGKDAIMGTLKPVIQSDEMAELVSEFTLKKVIPTSVPVGVHSGEQALEVGLHNVQTYWDQISTPK